LGNSYRAMRREPLAQGVECERLGRVESRMAARAAALRADTFGVVSAGIVVAVGKRYRTRRKQQQHRHEELCPARSHSPIIPRKRAARLQDGGGLVWNYTK